VMAMGKTLIIVCVWTGESWWWRWKDKFFMCPSRMVWIDPSCCLCCSCCCCLCRGKVVPSVPCVLCGFQTHHWQPTSMLRVGWRNMCELPYFFENHEFHVIYCFTLAYVFFWRISDSRFMWIHDFEKNNWPNLLGLCHFPLNT
jgi:hypothetical protein